MTFFCLIVAAHTLGHLIVRNPPGQGWLVRAGYRMVTGLSLCAAMVISAGSLTDLDRAQGLMCFIAAVGMTWTILRRRWKPEAPRPDCPKAPYSWGERACLLVIGSALAIGAISVFSPPTAWDAVVAHLALPAQYVRMGRIAVLEGNTYSGYPHLMHALYTYAYATGGETGAQFISWLFAFWGCVFVYDLGHRLGGRKCGLASAAVFSTTPVFFDQAGVVSIDIAVTTVTAATLGALLSWYDERRLNWLLLAGFLAGSACGIRHTGYIVCALGFVGVLASTKPFRTREALAFGLLAVLGAAPWLLRSWIAVGNPVYPFFQGIFPSHILINEDFTSLGGHGSRHGARFYEVFWFPWRIIMAPGSFDGWNASPGGLILVLGIPGVVIGDRRARLLGLYCLAGVVFFFFFQHLARYLLPFFVAMMPVAALAACTLKKLRRLAWGVLGFALGFGLVLGLGMNHFKVPVALGLESREAYLSKRVERYEAFEWANKELRADGVVFTLDPRTYYLEMGSFKNFETLVPLLGRPLDEQLRWFEERNIRYLLYPVEYVEGSPRFTTSQLLGLFNRWRNTPEAFHPLAELLTTSRNGKENVVIYEIGDHPEPRTNQIRSPEAD